MMTLSRNRSAVTLLFVLGAAASSASAQQVQGRVYDAENGAPVGLAGIFVLDRDRDVVARSIADVEGRFLVEAPGGGEYILVVQRLGYFENETPLLALEVAGQYGVDFELRPEPIRLDPLEVSVANDRLEDYLTRELGENPNGILGYRVYQGVRLEEAKLAAEDNTDFFRELFIEVQHGAEGVCLGSTFIAMPERGSGQFGKRECGKYFYVDGYTCPAEHLESLDLDRIGVVVRLAGDVHLYTRDFDWTFRPGSGSGAC